jgi:hypothetical protein
MNYTNQVYVHINYTIIVIYSMLLVTGSQSKNVSCFFLDMAKIEIADWSIIVQCHILVKYGF